MFRTALRLGVLPLFAALVVLGGESVPFWQWFAICFLSPFVLRLLLCSFWRLKRDPNSGVVPHWAQKLVPWVWAVSVVLILSVPLTSWPLHLSFQRSKPQLEQLIANARAEKKIDWPQSAGNFKVLDLHLDHEATYFCLADEEGAPRTTLIYSENSRAMKDYSGSNSAVILGENWVYSEPFD